MNLNTFTGFSLLLFTAISLTFPSSARASDPVILETGKTTTFPTWEGSKNTRLCIVGMGGDTFVQINAGAQQESLSTGNGQTTCIQRSWGGIIIGVTNSGLSLVKVWTS